MDQRVLVVKEAGRMTATIVDLYWFMNVPMRLPGLNDMLDKKRRSRGRGDLYSFEKSAIEKVICACVREQGIKPLRGDTHFTYIWREKSMRRDPSNIIAATKYIEDALQKAKIMTNDGWRDVLGIKSYWMVDRDSPGVSVIASSGEIDRITAMRLGT